MGDATLKEIDIDRLMPCMPLGAGNPSCWVNDCDLVCCLLCGKDCWVLRDGDAFVKAEGHDPQYLCGECLGCISAMDRETEKLIDARIGFLAENS